jgi:hypothetical protein
MNLCCRKELFTAPMQFSLSKAFRLVTFRQVATTYHGNHLIAILVQTMRQGQKWIPALCE